MMFFIHLGGINDGLKSTVNGPVIMEEGWLRMGRFLLWSQPFHSFKYPALNDLLCFVLKRGKEKKKKTKENTKEKSCKIYFKRLPKMFLLVHD